jgi:hypothetical protein
LTKLGGGAGNLSVRARVTQDRGFELLVDQDPCRLAQQALGVAAGTTGQVVICLKALIGASYLINRCLRSRSR